jgi:pullulanase
MEWQVNRSRFIRFFFVALFFSINLGLVGSPPATLAQVTSCDQAILHYRRIQPEYDGWGLHVWGATQETVTWEEPLEPGGQDEYGIYWLVRMASGAEELNYIIHKGEEKDPGPDQQLVFAEKGCEIWLVEGQGSQYTGPQEAIAALTPSVTEAPVPQPDQVILHYRRVKGDYPGWGLHVWGPTLEEGVTWSTPLLPDGQDDYGIYWIIQMEPGAGILNYIVHKGDQKDPGPDQSLDLTTTGNEIWLIEGSSDQFTDPERAHEALLSAGVGDIKNKAQAHWLTEDTIAWPVEFGSRAEFILHHDPSGEIRVTQDGLQGGQQIRLEFVDDNLDLLLAEKFPHLRHAVQLRIPPEFLPDVPAILKGQLAVSVSGLDGNILTATALQIPGVLDDLYSNDESLGISWKADSPTLRVWAPTARSVTLHLFDSANPDSNSSPFPMELAPETGIWSITGDPGWKNKFYLYEVAVFVRQAGQVVQNFVTDPYSISLSTNSTRSQIVNLDDAGLKPEGWDELTLPDLQAPEDAVIYELHVRDFSALDDSVPAEYRGTYLAFTEIQSNGMRHLSRLAQAGLTHVHLLPVFDFATVNENRVEWAKPDNERLASLPPDSPEQQSILSEIRGQDGYNWGYDPFHYTTPEGSYATNPEGSDRILEFRRMVSALNQTGLRVVIDVVYNHTHAAGQSEKSVLDRIVPGYYHRLDANGNVTTSTCCPNTASEHAMMEKLMIDSTLTWAKAYKVSGFRFDLMGHHMVRNMRNVRTSLDQLVLENDAGFGKSIILYGEGWNFGEVAGNARGENATQQNLAGSGIASFNDRIRDAARGGNPFSGLQDQGFATGLYTDPNETDSLPPESQLAKLLELTDQIRLSMSGNLMDYLLENYEGLQVSGSQVGYNGQPAGYTKDPQENLVYVSSHDNETLFDAIQYKAPFHTSLAERVRMQNLALSLVAFSQGIPFFASGSELLQSKSLDRDSYDSGDWFNRLDFTYQSNNWGVGLPPKEKNEANWPLMQTLLSQENLKPGPEHIQTNLAHFEEILEIRRSSPLFRLRTAEQVSRQVHFFNTGAGQILGLIIMSISDDPNSPLDDQYDLVVAVINAGKREVSYQVTDWFDQPLRLHPVLAQSSDPLVRTANFDAPTATFHIPTRTAAVFVLPKEKSEQISSTEFQTGSDSPFSREEERQEPGTPAAWLPLVAGLGILLILGLGLLVMRLRNIL